MTNYVICVLIVLFTSTTAYAGKTSHYAEIKQGKEVVLREAVDTKADALALASCPCGQEPFVVNTKKEDGDRGRKITYVIRCKKQDATSSMPSVSVRVGSPPYGGYGYGRPGYYGYGPRPMSYPSSARPAPCPEPSSNGQPLAIPGSTPTGVTNRSSVEDMILAAESVEEEEKRQMTRLSELERQHGDVVDAKDKEIEELKAKLAESEAQAEQDEELINELVEKLEQEEE